MWVDKVFQLDAGPCLTPSKRGLGDIEDRTAQRALSLDVLDPVASRAANPNSLCGGLFRVGLTKFYSPDKVLRLDTALSHSKQERARRQWG